MRDEKITISMDEVNYATPVPGSTPPPSYNSGYVHPESGSEMKPKRTGFHVAVGVAVVALLCFTGIGIMALLGGTGGDGPIPIFRERTVADYKAEVERAINQELAKPNSSGKRRIEQAHLTVDVTSANIVRCDVTTVDGTERAGKDDANISQVSTLIRFHWKGIIDSGYTDLRVVKDVRNDRLLKSEIEYTTALINVEDPDLWMAVGALLFL